VRDGKDFELKSVCTPTSSTRPVYALAHGLIRNYTFGVDATAADVPGRARYVSGFLAGRGYADGHGTDSEQQLISVGTFLMRQIIDAKTIGETLRMLLIERGVFTDAEYLAKYEEVAALLAADIKQKAAAAQDQQLLNLLLQAPIGRVQ
jgi:hypothetical protein